MEHIFCLTCNNHPIAASFDKDKLNKKMNESIESTVNDDTLEILNRTEDLIAYHTGICYCTDKYEIEEVELI